MRGRPTKGPRTAPSRTSVTGRHDRLVRRHHRWRTVARMSDGDIRDRAIEIPDVAIAHPGYIFLRTLRMTEQAIGRFQLLDKSERLLRSILAQLPIDFI